MVKVLPGPELSLQSGVFLLLLPVFCMLIFPLALISVRVISAICPGLLKVIFANSWSRPAGMLAVSPENRSVEPSFQVALAMLVVAEPVFPSLLKLIGATAGKY
jgi:hypothetical protein